MRYIRHIILFILKPLLWIAGRMHMPYSRPYIDMAGLENLKILPGDVLLTKTAGEFANFLTPLGKWKHSAIYLGKNIVLESNHKGVVFTNLVDFILEKKKVSVMRPKNKIDIELLSVFASIHRGKKYDYGLMVGANKFYCSELVFEALNYSSNSLIFKRRKIWGELTVSPDDFYYADKYFFKVGQT